MPPSRTQVSCPNCRQPVVVELQQLFDLNQEPAAKERLLAGASNYIRCPHCGYQGNLATPIVYHDPQKELLLTFVPAELGLPRPEQERLLGSLINQVVNGLPQEKRKGYLLNPQATLTHQGLMERILEADGITKEMIEAQQKKLSLLQRLVDAADDVLEVVVKQEDSLIDAEFFGLLTQLIEGSLASGDQEGAQKLTHLQTKLLEHSTYGSQVNAQIQEMEAAVKSLRDAGDGLTREKLLELVIAAPNETRLRALVSLARQGMDYTFFQLLTDQIEAAGEDQKDTLTGLRENLLSFTREVDQQVETRLRQARQQLNAILQSHNIVEATAQNLGSIDNFFVQALNDELDAAQRGGNQERVRKLEQVLGVLQQASQPNEEIQLVQELLEESDPAARRRKLEDQPEVITPEFLEVVSALLNQSQSSGNEDLTDQLREIHRQALRLSMQANLRGS